MPRRNYNHNKAKYGTRSLRPLLKQHTLTTDWVSQALLGDTPLLATREPLMTPEVQLHGAPRGEALFPIIILDEEGKSAQPASLYTLQNLYYIRRLKLQFEVLYLSSREIEAEDWLEQRHLFMGQRAIGKARKALSELSLGDVNRFKSICLESLSFRFPKRNVNRSNMLSQNVIDYFTDQVDIVLELDIACKLQHTTYANFIDFFKRFRNVKARPPENVLERALRHLPSSVSVDSLLRLSFYGLVDASQIFPNHYVLSDVLNLASAMGRISFGAFTPTATQANTYIELIINGRQSSATSEISDYIIDAADRLMSTLKLECYRDKLEDICRSIIDGRPIMTESEQEEIWSEYRTG